MKIYLFKTVVEHEYALATPGTTDKAQETMERNTYRFSQLRFNNSECPLFVQFWKEARILYLLFISTSQGNTCILAIRVLLQLHMHAETHQYRLLYAMAPEGQPTCWPLQKGTLTLKGAFLITIDTAH